MQAQFKEGQTATNPQTGEKVIFQGGNWQPIQTQSSNTIADGQTATNPNTGEKIVYQNGQWQPIEQPEQKQSFFSQPSEELKATARGQVKAAIPFYDELSGAANVAKEVITSPFKDKVQPLGEAYKQGRDAARADEAQFAEQHPVLATTSELMGGALIPGMGGAKLVKGAGLGANIAKGAIGGAIGGVIGGADTGEGLKDTSVKALQGGAIGAGVGGALAPIASGVGKVAKGITNRIANKVDETDYLKSILTPAERTQALEQLRTSSPGTPLALADLLEGNGRDITNAVKTNLPEAGKIIRADLKLRSEGAHDRVNQLLQEASPVKDYFDNLDDIVARKATIGEQGFQKSFFNPDKTLKTIPIKGNEKMFMKQADRIAEVKKALQLDEGELPDNSVRLLHEVKRKLDSDIKKAYANKDNWIGERLKAQKTELLDSLSQVPTYRKALSDYKGEMELQDSIETGLKKFRQLQPQEIKRYMSNPKISNSEKEGFLTGAMQGLHQKIDDTVKEGGNIYDKILSRPGDAKRIEELLGTEKFNIFKDRLKLEDEINTTMRTVTQGTQTAEKLTTNTMYASKLARGADRLKNLLSLKTVVDLVQKGDTRINAVNQRKLAKALTNREDGITALEKMIATEKNATEKSNLRKILSSAIYSSQSQPQESDNNL